MSDVLKAERMSTKLNSDLSGQTIIVTGATSGLGREMALCLATKYGVHVIATGRRKERLEELTESAKKSGGKISVYPLDVTDHEAVNTWCEELAHQKIDGAILNAGVTFCDLFENGSFEEDTRLVETNITAILQLTRGLIKPLSSNPNGARLMYVASLGGLVPLPYQAVYAGTKAFVINYGLSLREELKPNNIDLSIFAPGGFNTEMTNIDAMAGIQDAFKSVEAMSDAAIDGFIKRRGLFLPDVGSKMIGFIAKFLPRSFLAARVAKIYKKARQ